MIRVTLLLAFLAVTCAQQTAPSRDPSQLCFECKGQRNQKDHYANPDDCHTYYQCFYPEGVDGNVAIGILRKCQPGTFWYEGILGCVPEGRDECTDRCHDADTNRRGCYADGDSCRSFFVCSTGVSYHMCCPGGTAFNENLCMCEESATCDATCTQQEVEREGTTRLPVQGFDDFCIDSFGVRLSPGSAPDKFMLIDDEGVQIERTCAFGSEFSLEDCECAVLLDVSPQPTDAFCEIYYPFDGDVLGYGQLKGFTDIVGGSIVGDVAARGNGSAQLIGESNGHLEFPETKTHFFSEFTICMFVRCASPPCTYDSGSLISQCGRESLDEKNEDSFTISFAENNELIFDRVCDDGSSGASRIPLPASLDTNDFVHICFERYEQEDGLYMKIYVNKEVVSDNPDICPYPYLPLRHCSLVMGYEPINGPFDGYIDEPLICYHHTGPEGVAAHFEGRQAMEDLGLIPNSE